MERFVCIHGHFYQPPRENPWLEAIEIQDSAHPYHDWNERITAECYAPNTASRQLDREGRIRGIVSNYARISFNFGPTLLSWMERFAPDTYRAILAADRQSIAWRSGHGAALAQVYNHPIMPLASLRDKRTQVRWGIRDFERRFCRFPEGLWLAETAADTETLEVLAEAGIRFTILAPRQARQVRRLGTSRWRDADGGRVDPSRAYRCRLPSGRSIDLFFYDGPISQAVAFEKLLESGERFAQRLLSGFAGHRSHAQLVNIATDGETYGHHHPFGDQALGYTLGLIEGHGLARLTNYGEYLALHPPTHEVQIVEQSSWSCVHGVERWRSDCGCNSGGNPGWNQTWRQPLRKALDWLGEQLAAEYQRVAAGLLRDPWGARDDYIAAILDRSPENIDAFLQEQALRPPDDEEAATILCLLEMQRHALLMFTSCGWFFDELTGLETVQILQYADRAIQLAERCCDRRLTLPFLERLAPAASNIPALGDGAAVFRRFVEPARIDLVKVGAHYAVSSIFAEYDQETAIFSYRATREDLFTLAAGGIRLTIGRLFIRSTVTRKADRITFCSLYFGGHALNCGVRSFLGDSAYQEMKQEVSTAFQAGDFAAIIRLMDTHFGTHTYSLKDLFRDEQRHVLQLIIAGTLQEFEETFGSLYEGSRALMGFVRETGMPVPHRFLTTAETALNLQLQGLFSREQLATERLAEILAEMAGWQLQVDSVALEFSVRRRLEQAMLALAAAPLDRELLAELLGLLAALPSLPVTVNLWQTQNLCWSLLRAQAAALRFATAASGADNSWSAAFRELGRLLNFDVEAVVTSGGDV